MASKGASMGGGGGCGGGVGGEEAPRHRTNDPWDHEGLHRYHKPTVRAENEEVKMEDLLPREMWASCLEFATSTTFRAKRWYESSEIGRKLFRDEDMGPLPLRATCTLFSTLCLEIITDIKVCSDSDLIFFPIKSLAHVLLARPRSLKSINVEADVQNDGARALEEDLFRQLSLALKVEEIVLNLEVVVPGSLLLTLASAAPSSRNLI